MISGLDHLQSLALAPIKFALQWGSDNLRAPIFFSKAPNLLILVLAALFGSKLNSVPLEVLSPTVFSHILKHRESSYRQFRTWCRKLKVWPVEPFDRPYVFLFSTSQAAMGRGELT